MAELNYSSQATRDYMTDMCKYWLSFGLDGFRLDAIKHIYLLGELNPNLKGTIANHKVTYDVGFKTYWNEEMGKQDTVPNDYSYDTDMNVLFWKQFAGCLKASYPNCFLVGENFDGWDERMAPFYEAIDSQFDFSTYYHLNERKEDAMGNSMEVSLGEYKKYRNDLINGAYTSNHDVARMLNHAAAHNSDVDQAYAGNPGNVKHHAEVNDSNKAEANNMARYYAAMTILNPGVSWIYYGDEIGMSGNTNDSVEDSHGLVYNDHGNNVDRWYRQPMRWGTTKGSDNVVNYTFGGIEVLWDNYNKNLAPVSTQKADANSMLNYFKAVCAVKNDDAYPTYGSISGTGSINGIAGTSNFKISDGTREVAVFVNNTNDPVSIGWMGYSLLGSSVGGSANSVPSHGFVVLKKN
jgi:glycosidase